MDDYGHELSSVSNRFFDTFSKLQILNAHMEFTKMPAFVSSNKANQSKQKEMATSYQAEQKTTNTNFV